ncbi:MAG TPA: TlpA disulfide reductase family protein [Chitinophagaceae bacterium]
MHKILSAFFLLLSTSVFSQAKISYWQASIHRTDGNSIPFSFKLEEKNKKTILYIINDAEKIKVDNILFTKDSVFIKMPVFESSFKARIVNGEWEGLWTKGTSGNDQVLPFSAHKRIDTTLRKAEYNIAGRWAVTFADDKTKADASIAEFRQIGNKVAGTFLTPSGDYRYLDGIIDGNKLRLSTFDGAHAYFFTADIVNSKQIINGIFYAGAKGKDGWVAIKDANAKVLTDAVAMHLKPGEEKLDFYFPDLNGKDVSINDKRFKNKVVVIQIMGSWCPNCMDETVFLSDYYNKNKHRGFEAVALAYEYSTDFNRSVKSISKFQKRFNMQYPILVTGVKVSDSLRTEKTLPQLTPIKVFPSSIIIDKHGKVRKFETDFFGPGTGAHYEAYKKEFYATIDGLLKEK